MSSAEALWLTISFTAIVAGVAIWWGWSMRHRLRRDLLVTSLPRDQRRQVNRAVNRGQAVSDPTLAPAAVELAEKLANRRESEGFPWLGRRSRWRYAIAAFCAIAVVSQLIGHHWVEAVVWAYIGYYLPFGQHQILDRQHRKFERSLVANQI